MTRVRASRRLLVPWLIGLALVLRALVPTGWMTAAAADGGVTLIPCMGVMPPPEAAAGSMSMHGGHPDAAAPHGSHHDGGPRQDHDGKAQQPCAFAGLALAWTPAAPPPLRTPARVDPPAYKPTQLGITGRGLAAPPPPATGPPLSA